MKTAPPAALCAALAAVLLSACGPAGPLSWSPAVQVVPAPGGSVIREPQLTTSDRAVLLSWIEFVDNTPQLRFAERVGAGWSEPLTVSSGDDWFLTADDVPSVLRLSDGTLVAHWMQLTDEILEASNLWLSYSKDEGKSWAPAFTPHHDGTKTQHGFASLFEMPSKGLGLVWLDGRSSELSQAENAPDMSLRFTSFDTSWKQAEDVALDTRVCECCPTTTAVTSDGVLTAYRDRSEKEVRDIAVSRLENGVWTPGRTVHADNWEVDSCPVNGPALSARGQRAVAAWFTTAGDEGRVLAAFSSDGGRSWGDPVRLDDGTALGRVDVELLQDGSAIVSWVELVNRRSEFRLRRIDSTGAKSDPIIVTGASGGRPSGIPHIASHGNELVLAWMESAGGDITSLTLRTATARLP